ncbi:MAG TPA: hypothetical protein VHF88_00310 [Thermoleophilaceae bacterium]|nr:hypothetical protein [Thermoleophilaceae bacterium]
MLTQVEATPQHRSTWWPARRTPTVNKIVGFGLAAVVAVVVLVIGAQLFSSPSNVGSGAESTPTIQPTRDSSATPSTSPRPSPSAGFSRFNSTMHGISIDYPSGWEIRQATEPWTGGALNFDSAASDVIFDPTLGDRLYIVLASQPGRADPFDHQSDQFDLIDEAGVCDPEGGMGGGNFTVDGASAWGQICAPGIRAATYVEVVAVTTETRRYLIVLVESGDEPGLRDAYDFEAALETVDLHPDEDR